MHKRANRRLFVVAAAIAIGTLAPLGAASWAGVGNVGDTTAPQPQSNADLNSGGANGQCPGGIYCSTRDGSASQNGNGDGNAYGKPCAGCVGKADNKNPPGQEKADPNGTFPNNGYECDANSGIGQTNPAHTGCTSPSPSVSPSPSPSVSPSPEPSPSESASPSPSPSSSPGYP